ncbi:MAG: uroporphyrinogen decarboxylase, partial [Eubacterium sp.]
IIMGATGVMQHPEVHSLEPEEYDTFIKDPFFYMSETLMPRLYPSLDTTPGRRAMVLAQAVKANSDQFAIIGQTMGKIAGKYGYPKAPSGRSTAPFDYLADFLRSFTGIAKDMRRCPEKVVDACDALVSVMFREGIPNPEKLPQNYRVMIPLHMGSFINEKQFEKFYWPSFKRLMDRLVEPGAGVDLFVEDDWMRHMDYLKELKGSVKMQFEYGDPKLVKEKLENTQ